MEAAPIDGAEAGYDVDELTKTPSTFLNEIEKGIDRELTDGGSSTNSPELPESIPTR